MRVFGLLGLVLALVIVGLIAKKQLTTTAVAPVLPSVPGAAAPAPDEAPADVRTQSRQVQQQVKDALDAAAQARKMPDDN
ncbi:uncharacterized protein YkwD [Variovorax boronicumulans]|uniref:hypothetical protein n=1 Tax=Variovorax TaxID=34072 RepID=UPI002783EF42|nr:MULTISPECIES: hypothetical protein [Variovorax]MDQ0036155.1 uncharacterized protein YkwD [Variovorax boronicumulans]MDQ0041317.1 uncharacterized protein YkwD [Variovorax boronicumulans]MDQ0608381.1 uncharacterized protein YkwD [Variovorax sp. W1I1]